MEANFEPSPGQCIVHWFGGTGGKRCDLAPDSEKGLRWGFTVSSVQNQVAGHRMQAVVG